MPQADAQDTTNMILPPVILAQSLLAYFISALGTGHFR